jgi:hypothetical protein
VINEEALHNQIRIDAVLFKDCNGYWIVQAIQYNIVAKAKNIGEVREAFRRQLAANLALNSRFGRRGLKGISPAPERFRILFEEAREMLHSVDPLMNYHEKLDIRLVDFI